MSVWHEQWIDLADDFRCVLMDHRSHGSSGDAALGDLSVRAMGRDIAAVLDAVAPDRPAVVVGHSMYIRKSDAEIAWDQRARGAQG